MKRAVENSRSTKGTLFAACLWGIEPAMVKLYELSGKTSVLDPITASTSAQKGAAFQLIKESSRDIQSRIMAKRLAQGRQMKQEPKRTRRQTATELRPNRTPNHLKETTQSARKTISRWQQRSKNEPLLEKGNDSTNCRCETNDIEIRRDEFILRKKMMKPRQEFGECANSEGSNVKVKCVTKDGPKADQVASTNAKNDSSSNPQLESGIDKMSLGGKQDSDVTSLKKSKDETDGSDQPKKIKEKRLRFKESVAELSTEDIEKDSPKEDDEEIVELFKDEDDITALVRMINTSLGVAKNGRYNNTTNAACLEPIQCMSGMAISHSSII